MKNHDELLIEILEGEYIKPVYQPIVSLTDGQIYGYEALSRISNSALQMNIEQMFKTADRINKSWELEELCREKALKHSVNKEPEKKLFLNVNSNIMYDKKFKEGVTKTFLSEYGLDSDAIIFEITERASIADSKTFLNSINHYKTQNYGIAIDDVGAGYSGLNSIANVKPNFIKLDMVLIRNIDKDVTKQLLCKAMVDFGKSTDIKLIAEGIETEEELRTLISLNIDLGQGYFLGIPQETFQNISREKIDLIKNYHGRIHTEIVRSSVYPRMGCLAKPGYTFSPDEKVEDIYEILRLNPTITEFTVIEDDIAIGFMTRTAINESMGGRYGYSLHYKKVVRQIINTDFLRVNANMTVDEAARFAMQRPSEQLYNPIVVEKDNKYLGIVTIKDLLNTCTKVEIDAALSVNPLTGLPGNRLIEKEILNRVLGSQPYCIIYYDIDNFKAYNDAYGFPNGDKMLHLMAEILKKCAVNNEFVGHIGGDDFIVICDYHEGQAYCDAVLERFSSKVMSLYCDRDINNGYILSKNRHDVPEKFPIASLSIAGISNKNTTYHSIEEFTKDISLLKSKCKQQPGNYYEVL